MLVSDTYLIPYDGYSRPACFLYSFCCLPHSSIPVPFSQLGFCIGYFLCPNALPSPPVCSVTISMNHAAGLLRPVTHLPVPVTLSILCPRVFSPERSDHVLAQWTISLFFILIICFCCSLLIVNPLLASPLKPKPLKNTILVSFAYKSIPNI